MDTRPSVSKSNPELRINARLSKNKAVISLDLSGESLHRRGYRLKQGGAPLKENLAAGILLRAGWPALAQQGAALLDPMCGSGTLLIEAAYMAADIAPGLGRANFGFERWLNHRNDVWLECILDSPKKRMVAPWCRVVHHSTEKWMMGMLTSPTSTRMQATRAPLRRSSNAAYRPMMPR